MPKATITFSDTEDGKIECDCEFTPELTKDTTSAAQAQAIMMIEGLQRALAKRGVEIEDEEYE